MLKLYIYIYSLYVICIPPCSLRNDGNCLCCRPAAWSKDTVPKAACTAVPGGGRKRSGMLVGQRTGNRLDFNDFKDSRKWPDHIYIELKHHSTTLDCPGPTLQLMKTCRNHSPNEPTVRAINPSPAFCWATVTLPSSKRVSLAKRRLTGFCRIGKPLEQQTSPKNKTQSDVLHRICLYSNGPYLFCFWSSCTCTCFILLLHFFFSPCHSFFFTNNVRDHKVRAAIPFFNGQKLRNATCSTNKTMPIVQSIHQQKLLTLSQDFASSRKSLHSTVRQTCQIWCNRSGWTDICFHRS